MTDNEKAATFIGWTPFAVCNYYPECTASHPIAAPDMTDPRNYMKALEIVRAKGYVWSLSGQANRLIGADKRIHAVAFWGYHRENLAKEIYGDSDDSDVAKAIIKALAALYDAEHRDENQ